MDFLQKQVDFVDLMIKHIGTSAIMDLLLRMLTCIEPQQLRQDVLTVSTSHIIFNMLCNVFFNMCADRSYLFLLALKVRTSTLVDGVIVASRPHATLPGHKSQVLLRT